MSIDQVLEGINKKFGDGAIVKGAEAVGLKMHRLKTGSLSLDIAMGGGWAMGSMNELFGPYCVSGDTKIHYNNPEWASKNHRKSPGSRVRIATISEFYKMFSKNRNLLVECIDEDSENVILGQVKEVVISGIKEVFEVTTSSGFKVRTTDEHMFRTKIGYCKLKNLIIGDSVQVVTRKSLEKTKEDFRKDKEIYVKWHPFRPANTTREDGKYKYVRFREPTLIYEANLNGLSLEEYIELLNNYDNRPLKTIPRNMQVHHKNRNHQDNRIENLELLDNSSHGKLHPSRALGLTRKLKEDTIESIISVGKSITYDIYMEEPNHNFTANDFVVHNSGGKSYVSMLTMAQTQRDYPNANIALIDFECAFDSDWARQIGVDTSRLFVSTPDYMEDGLQIAIDLIKSGEITLLVIDSLGAACPKAELEGEITDFTVGLRARVGNKFVRKSRSKSSLLTEEVDLGKTTLIMINQIYSGIGPYAGIETPGGVQVKYGAMIRLMIRKGDLIQDKDGTLLMQESKFVVEKNRTAPPKKSGSFLFSVSDNPKGKRGEIYRAGEIITHGVLNGVIKRGGSWFYLPESLGEEKFQGEAKLADWVSENPDKYAELEKLVMKAVLKDE